MLSAVDACYMDRPLELSRTNRYRRIDALYLRGELSPRKSDNRYYKQNRVKFFRKLSVITRTLSLVPISHWLRQADKTFGTSWQVFA